MNFVTKLSRAMKTKPIIFLALLCIGIFIVDSDGQWWPPNVKVWGQLSSFADRRVYYRIVDVNREYIWGFGVVSEEIEVPNKVYHFLFIL